MNTIEVRLRSGELIIFETHAHINKLTDKLNKYKFIYLGNVILNTSEIESIKEV